MIFFTSDYHFYHNKDFIYQARGFETVEDMVEEIIKTHNVMVGPDDDVYILGDCMLNDNVRGLAALRRLNGRLHIIRGNHDTDERVELYKKLYNVVEVCDGKWLRYGKYNFYLSHLPCMTTSHGVRARMCNIHGHTHSPDFQQYMNLGCYNVAVDAHSLQPVPIDVIIEDFKDYGI